MKGDHYYLFVYRHRGRAFRGLVVGQRLPDPTRSEEACQDRDDRGEEISILSFRG